MWCFFACADRFRCKLQDFPEIKQLQKAACYVFFSIRSETHFRKVSDTPIVVGLLLVITYESGEITALYLAHIHQIKDHIHK
jgi:hypothetical protein